jgi:hypothetical protein
MTLPTATLDHVVINARDDMDRAADVYRRLGFTLTERGYHSLGSMNHLAMFGTDYLELIALPAGATSGRLDLLDYACGVNGLVFGTEDSAATYTALNEAGVPIDPPVEFTRPVRVDGRMRDARFRTVRLKAGTVPYGRVYYCHHFTRIWFGGMSGANMTTAPLPWREPQSSKRIPREEPGFMPTCSVRRRCARSRAAAP